MATRTFVVGETIIELACADERQTAQIEELWLMLFNLRPVEANVSVTAIRLNFQAPTSCSHQPSPITPVSGSGNLRSWRTTTGFYVTCGESSLHVLLAEDCGTGVLVPEFWGLPLADKREFFLLVFLMLLRQHGYFSLHANGIVKESDGVLIVGESGTGKTTLTLSLIQHGWHYLADDTLLLYRAGEHIQAFGFRRGFACRPHTIDKFPSLATQASVSPELANGKKFIPDEAISSNVPAEGCVPRLLLFPQITDRQYSQLVPLDETSAMATLMRLSTGILIDRTRVVQQIEVLKRTIYQARCFCIRLGCDVYQDSISLSDLLAQVLERSRQGS